MRQLLQCSAIRGVCYALIIAIVSAIAPMPLATPAGAQLMPTYSVAVVEFTNQSGVLGDTLARLATDAVVVEMSKTNRYDVGTTRSQLKLKMEEMDLHPPLDKVSMVRLGEALGADAILEGTIKSVQLAGSGATRRATATIAMQMIDQASGQVINGAVQTGSSAARVGYTPEDEALMGEAINKAAFMAVKTMSDYIIPEATVQMNIGGDQVTLNKGVRDGLKPGMRMIVLRHKEIIGFIELREVNPKDSTAKVVQSMRGIQSEDRVRAIYDMPIMGISSAKSDPMPSSPPPANRSSKGAFQKIGKFILGAAIVFGLFSLFKGGRGSEDSPSINPAGATEIAWDPSKYGHGVNVLEYQIIRDSFDTGAVPVKVISDPTDVDAGRTNLASLYGSGGGTKSVSYKTLTTNPATSYSSASTTLDVEAYGDTHQYQVRVLYRNQASSSTTDTSSVKYYYTPVSNTITMTVTEPVLNADIQYPMNDGVYELPLSQLEESDTPLFAWTPKRGADVYQVVAEPIPATGLQLKSALIYSTNDYLAQMSMADRRAWKTQLETYVAAHPDVTWKWRVYSRHQGDTSTAWVVGEDNRFLPLAATPDGP